MNKEKHSLRNFAALESGEPLKEIPPYTFDTKGANRGGGEALGGHAPIPVERRVKKKGGGEKKTVLPTLIK